MKTHSFYDPATGIFTGRQFSTSLADPDAHAAALIANTPADHAHIEGAYDCLSQRVVDGQVVEYQPPPPSADHEWNAATKRWQLTAAAQKRHGDALQARALEGQQHSLVRRLALNPNDADARARLQALHDQITLLEDQQG